MMRYLTLLLLITALCGCGKAEKQDQQQTQDAPESGEFPKTPAPESVYLPSETENELPLEIEEVIAEPEAMGIDPAMDSEPPPEDFLSPPPSTEQEHAARRARWAKKWEDRTEGLAERLGLDGEREMAFRTIRTDMYEARRRAYDELKHQEGSKREKWEQAVSTTAPEYDQHLRGILTEDEFEEYMRLRDRRSRRRRRRNR